MPIITAEQILNPSDYNAPRATLGFLPDGAGGVRMTLSCMVGLVKQYRKNPEIRAKAESLIANVREKDRVGEVRAVFDFVQQCIRYTEDVRDVETLKTPDLTLSSAQGDCDDKSTLISSLLESIGFATRFVAIGMAQHDAFDHVYSEVKLGTIWVALETTENVPMGWKPPNPAAIMVRHV